MPAARSRPSPLAASDYTGFGPGGTSAGRHIRAQPGNQRRISRRCSRATTRSATGATRSITPAATVCSRPGGGVLPALPKRSRPRRLRRLRLAISVGASSGMPVASAKRVIFWNVDITAAASTTASSPRCWRTSSRAAASNSASPPKVASTRLVNARPPRRPLSASLVTAASSTSLLLARSRVACELVQ